MTEIGDVDDWKANDGNTSGGTSFTLTADFTINEAISHITLAAGDTFDGNGYVITLGASVTSFEGLFILAGGTIKDLGVEADNNATTGQYFGWMVKQGNAGSEVGNYVGTATIQDCYVKCNSISDRSGGIYGNVAGYYGDVKIQRCYVYNSGTMADNSGGIVGYYAGSYSTQGTITIDQCYYKGPIGTYCGGIAGSYCGKLKNVTIKNCYSYVTGTSGTDSGGIIGSRISYLSGSSTTLTIEDCYATGSGSLGATAGGICGRDMFYGVTSACIANITRCWCDLNEGVNSMGGIVGSALCATATAGTVNISNCYWTGNFTYNNGSSSGGIVGPNCNAANAAINITNCYTTFAGTFGIIINPSNYTNLVVRDCVMNGSLSSGSPTISGSSHTPTTCSTTIGDIQGSLYTIAGNSATADWPTSTWTAVIGDEPYLVGTSLGFTSTYWSASTSNASHPYLKNFASSPWDTTYNAYTVLAALTAGGGGGGAGGGGDPHITPFLGKKYDLPHTEDTFLWFDNNNKYDRLTVKVKCWHLPKDTINLIYNRLVYNKLTRAEKYKQILDTATYFKYVKFEYNGFTIIIDMDNLYFRKYTNEDDLKNNNLPEIQYANHDMSIGVSKIKLSNKGLYSKQSYIKSNKTIERTITVNTRNGFVRFTLARDRTNVIYRNSIEVNFQRKIDLQKCDGIIISRDKMKVVQF
jgi:hypothetical protein